MKILATEGLDKAGKKTATDILEAYFQSKGLQVERMSFPQYDSPMGALIGQWLKGTFEADPKVFELLQAADKQHGQQFIQACEDRGVDVLLIDRYVHTEWAYGAYDNDEDWIQELTKYMRLPDIVLYMDVEPEVSMHRRGKYGDDDRYESDIERLRYTKNEYECLFVEKKDAIDIRMVDANLPPLIVKSQVLRFAGDVYESLTGQPMIASDILDNITREEAESLLSWGNVIGLAI